MQRLERMLFPLRRIPNKTLLQLSLGVSTLLAGEGVSRACSGLQCDPVELGPPAAAALPANVPSFYVRPDRIYHADAGTIEPEAGVHLLNGAGQSLPFDLSPDVQTGGFWVKPKSALSPGQYTLGVSSRCDRQPGYPETGSIKNAIWKDIPITVTAPATLPTVAGTLAAKETRLANDYVTGPRCHSTDRPSAIVAFAFEPSAALKPFLPVARLTLKVDGREWATSRVGTTDVPRTIYQSDRSSLEVHTLCRANTGSEFHVRDEGLTAGNHTAELTVTLAGGVQLPPLSVPFSINCSNEGPPQAVDGGGVDGAQGLPQAVDAGGAGVLPGGNDAGGSHMPAVEKASAGCSYAHKKSTSTGSFSYGALFAAAMLLVRRARRSNRSEG